MKPYKAIILTALLIVSSCGKDVPTPSPAQTSFTLKGKSIAVKGEMKPGATASLSEVKASVKMAIHSLE